MSEWEQSSSMADLDRALAGIHGPELAASEVFIGLVGIPMAVEGTHAALVSAHYEALARAPAASPLGRAFWNSVAFRTGAAAVALEACADQGLLCGIVLDRISVASRGTGLAPGRLTMLGTKATAVERAAAGELARMGRNVVVKDPTGARSAAGSTADLLVDGVPMDVYSPQAGTSVKKILQRVAGKNDQAQGVVLDLSAWDGPVDELGDVLARVQGKLRADGSPSNIQEVIITGR
jgi:hypothetical protein